LRSRYGQHPSQYADRLVPDSSKAGTVVLLHGGFWRLPYGSSLMDDLAQDLAERGWVSWNVEYRRLGEGGGWPATFEDVRAAIDLAAESHGAGPLATVGHSAGGQLALWGATHPRVTHAVAQAGVVDLATAAELGLSRGAANELVGGRETLFERTSPRALLPLGVPQLLVHGELDEVVPVELSRDYARAAGEAGDEAELVIIAGCGHYEHLDPGSAAWAAVVDWLPRASA